MLNSTLEPSQSSDHLRLIGQDLAAAQMAGFRILWSRSFPIELTRCLVKKYRFRRETELRFTNSTIARLVKRIAAVFMLFIGVIALALDSENNSDGTPKSIPRASGGNREDFLKETKTPGAGIALVSRDKVEWVAGIGKADVAANKPATAETLFRIGSTSKAFAALAALQLQEQGKLKLTDTVHQWGPEVVFSQSLGELTDPVRLVHLMEHTSGFDRRACTSVSMR